MEEIDDKEHEEREEEEEETTSINRKKRKKEIDEKGKEKEDEEVEVRIIEAGAASNDGVVKDEPGEDDPYFSSLPSGYRFNPYDHELVMDYLMKKINDEPLPRNKINEVTLYKYSPEDLAVKYKQNGEKEWFFFTPRDRKYKNGDRPNRAAGNGYWKATGADKKVYHIGMLVGYRKALVFYVGKPPKGLKTDWIMHEYTVNYDYCSPTATRKNADFMSLDRWVLCRIYRKTDKPPRARSSADDDHEDVRDEEVPTSNERDLSETFYYNDMGNDMENLINTDFVNLAITESPFGQPLPYASLPPLSPYASLPPLTAHFPTMDNIEFGSENQFNAPEFPITDPYSTLMNIHFQPLNQVGLFDPNPESYDIFSQGITYDQNLFLEQQPYFPIANVGENPPPVSSSTADDDAANFSSVNDVESRFSAANESWTYSFHDHLH